MMGLKAPPQTLPEAADFSGKFPAAVNGVIEGEQLAPIDDWMQEERPIEPTMSNL
jgi:hypothetical protein